MKQELNAGPRVVPESALMLLLIAALASTGAGSEDSAQRHSPPMRGVGAAQSLSQTVFETRRQRYIEAHPNAHVAREAAARSAKAGSRI